MEDLLKDPTGQGQSLTAQCAPSASASAGWFKAGAPPGNPSTATRTPNPHKVTKSPGARLLNVPRQRQLQLPAGGVPELDGAVGGARHKPLVGGVEGHRAHPAAGGEKEGLGWWVGGEHWMEGSKATERTQLRAGGRNGGLSLDGYAWGGPWI